MKPNKKKWRLLNGDCLEQMKRLKDNSVDSIVCDPPYGLTFMGKNWDHGIPGKEYWQEALRVLKPGGYLLACGGSRTFHRLFVAIEDAGFELRDTIMWLYGSGFPKSYNIAKGIEGKLTNGSSSQQHWDKLDGEKIDSKIGYTKLRHKHGNSPADYSDKQHTINVKFKTEEAKNWEGWGTALKPSYEPICLARKPIEKTNAENVLKWGTGGINIDASRIGNENTMRPTGKPNSSQSLFGLNNGGSSGSELGRYPANTILECLCDETKQTPLTVTKSNYKNKKCNVQMLASKERLGAQSYKGGEVKHTNPDCPCFQLDKQQDKASRFFYVAKASKRERNEGIPDKQTNNHPTVKPIKLMSYLIKLVTPPNGIVLDPFMGSGSTGVAAIKEGFQFIGIDKEKEYCELAKQRIKANE